MIDADKLLSMNRNEFIHFLNRKDIIPVTDNLIKYENIVYELTEDDMYLIKSFRNDNGYELEYKGCEKNKGDARRINGMLQSAANSFRNDIQYEKRTGDIIHKEKMKIVK